MNENKNPIRILENEIDTMSGESLEKTEWKTSETRQNEMDVIIDRSGRIFIPIDNLQHSSVCTASVEETTSVQTSTSHVILPLFSFCFLIQCKWFLFFLYLFCWEKVNNVLAGEHLLTRRDDTERSLMWLLIFSPLVVTSVHPAQSLRTSKRVGHQARRGTLESSASKAVIRLKRFARHWGKGQSLL